MEKFEEQFERVNRFYRRFKEIYQGMRDTTEDDIYCFFQNCYHLKDFLKNDDKYTKHDASAIEHYVHNNKWLVICADICNATKHLILKNKPTPTVSDNSTVVVDSENNTLIESDGTYIITEFKVKIEHEGTEYDAFDVATEALNAWKTFV